MSFTELITPLDCASIEYLAEDYPAIRIDHPAAQALIALHGAHVIEWQPTGEQPVIYTSPSAKYENGVAIRGGIPLCWPWFNAHPSAPSKPSHGVARNRQWKLKEAKSSEDEVVLTFELPMDDKVTELIGTDVQAILRLNIGSSLRVHLMTENTSEEHFRVGGALHSYFSVSDISNIRLEGLDGIAFIDTVGKDSLEHQQDDIHIQNEVDNIYIETTDTVFLRDPGWDRTVKISKSGSSTTVVWNPGPEKSISLKDLPDDGYQNFVCVEAANARRDVYDLEPGQLHCLVQTISIEGP